MSKLSILIVSKLNVEIGKISIVKLDTYTAVIFIFINIQRLIENSK